MRKQLSLAILLLLGLSLLSAGDYIIGTGTSTQTYVPVYGYNNFGWSKFMFTSAEMQASGFTTNQPITRIAFYVNNSPVNYVMDDQRVYMRHFYDAEYASSANNYPGITGFTNVYQGSVTWTGQGWTEITFTTPFNYIPTWGLEILWENRDGSKLAGPPIFRTTSTSNYSAVYKYQDPSFPTTSGTRSRNHRPNIWFVTPTTEPPSPAAAVTPLDEAQNVGINTKLMWNHTGGSPTGYRLWFGTNYPPSNIASNLVTTSTSYTPITYLEYGTTYYWRIVPFNDNGNAIDCPIWSFQTMPDPSITEFPYLQGFEGSWPPSGWTHHSGNLVDPIVLGAAGSSQWAQDDWLNLVTGDKAARINVWGTVSGFLISPLFNVPSDEFVIEFDAAILRYNQPPDGTPPNYANPDDRLAVLIGDGFTWSTAGILREYNNSGSEYVLNDIPTSGTRITIPLSGYNGHMKVAIFAGSTVLNDDNDLMINNFRIGLPEAAPQTPIVTISIDSVSGMPVLNWDAVPGATIYRVYKADSPFGEYQLAGNTASTSYQLTAQESKAFFKITAE